MVLVVTNGVSIKHYFRYTRKLLLSDALMLIEGGMDGEGGIEGGIRWREGGEGRKILSERGKGLGRTEKTEANDEA